VPLEPPPTPDELQRALGRLKPVQQEARRRRRRQRALLGASGVVLVAAAIGLPLGLTAGASNPTHVIVASPPPTTAAPSTTAPPTTSSPTSTPATAPPTTTPTTAPPTTSSPTTSPPAAGATGATCQAGQLAASLVHSGVAAGSAIDVIALTNTGSTTCTLEGYPGLALYDAQGQAIPASVQPGPVGGVSGPTLVTLAPGSSASFYLQFSSGTGIPGASCQPSTVGVTPPGSSSQVQLNATIEPCATAGTQPQLMVSALVAGMSP
jgi:hypothetical protein